MTPAGVEGLTMYYIGDGSQHWLGVPMRDHSEEEWKALPAATQQGLLRAGLFTTKRKSGGSVAGQAETPVQVEILSAPAEPVQGRAG
jgi:hypothetical protein